MRISLEAYACTATMRTHTQMTTRTRVTTRTEDSSKKPACRQRCLPGFHSRAPASLAKAKCKSIIEQNQDRQHGQIYERKRNTTELQKLRQSIQDNEKTKRNKKSTRRGSTSYPCGTERPSWGPRCHRSCAPHRGRSTPASQTATTP